jgi:prophage regulatory protein
MTANLPEALDSVALGDRLLPWRTVKELTGISRTTAWRLQNAGAFPRPLVISPGRIAWRESDVSAWKAALTPRNQMTEVHQRPLFASRTTPWRSSEPMPKPIAIANPTPDDAAQPSRRRPRPPPSNCQMAFDF